MNNRGQNQSHQRKFEGMYSNPNQFPQTVVQNPGYIISGPRNSRHYVNTGAHNVSDMKNNHMTNMAHSQIQMVPTHISQRQQALPHHIRPNAPRNLPRGPFQYQVYVPSNVAYQGTSNHPGYYPFTPPQASQTALLMPYVNYSTNQQGMFYSQPTRPIQMTNLPQGPQNPPVANMSNAQNSHGQSLIVQSQPMDMAPNTQSSSSSQPKETVEEPGSDLDSDINNKINLKCINILLEYEQMQNLDDIIYSLSEDKNSVIRTRHEEFVTSMSLTTLDSSPITRTTVAGKIFAELLSKKILSMDAITRGIDAVLKDWNDYLIDYPQFFSYIAAIIAPLLLSQNASFDFNNLKDSCTSIRPDNSSKFLKEVLNKILISKETQNNKEQLGGILWIYNKWNASENVTLDVFMPNNQIHKYLKKEQIGILILSIVIYDKMKLTKNKLLYNILQCWICTNISEEIIKTPFFVKSLTIAILIVCLKLNHSYEDFFDPVHVKLLSHFIEFEPLPVHEIQAREIQCMHGIQIISATLKHPGGMVLKLFNKLYHHRVISKESFELFIQDYEEITEK